ncbi:transcriptional activator AfrS [Escherichia coli DEC10F]|nr:transcriptional activator AfrS [Escherichia coli DEC10F]
MEVMSPKSVGSIRLFFSSGMEKDVIVLKINVCQPPKGSL